MVGMMQKKQELGQSNNTAVVLRSSYNPTSCQPVIKGKAEPLVICLNFKLVLLEEACGNVCPGS